MYHTRDVVIAADISPTMISVLRIWNLSEIFPHTNVWNSTFRIIGNVAKNVVSVTLSPRKNRK